jgi:hypothetical protein
LIALRTAPFWSGFGNYARTDHRIEPIACGEAEWAAPMTARIIIEIAHREGVEIAA